MPNIITGAPTQCSGITCIHRSNLYTDGSPIRGTCQQAQIFSLPTLQTHSHESALSRVRKQLSQACLTAGQQEHKSCTKLNCLLGSGQLHRDFHLSQVLESLSLQL